MDVKIVCQNQEAKCLFDFGKMEDILINTHALQTRANERERSIDDVTNIHIEMSGNPLRTAPREVIVLPAFHTRVIGTWRN